MFALNGESGIRTHAPFRTNGFQDRLVMTASISLQTCFSIIQDKKRFVKSFFNLFFLVFSYFVAVHQQLSYNIMAGSICQHFFYIFSKTKNVNIKFDIFSCFYRFAVLHNTQPVLLYIFTFRQRNSKAATSASLSRPLFPFLCKLFYLFLE